MAKLLKTIEKLISCIMPTSVRHALLPHVTRVFKETHRDVKRTYGFKIGAPNPAAIKDMEERILLLSQTTTDRLKGNLRFSLMEGMQEGEGADAISMRIKDVFVGDSVNVERISRNEIIVSSKVATIEAYEAAGVRAREWVAAPGGRTCGVCRRLDGKVAKTGTWFKHPDTNEDIMNDSAHPLCRCSTKPIFEEGGPNVN
jgi:SPP1 gp7 family putative phage head morphogenesis protein